MREGVASVLMAVLLSHVPNTWAGSQVISARGAAWSRPGLSGPQARMMAERGAQVAASRNLLVRESGSRRFAAPGYYHASGIVRGHQYFPPIYLPDGRTAVTVQKPGSR